MRIAHCVSALDTELGGRSTPSAFHLGRGRNESSVESAVGLHVEFHLALFLTLSLSRFDTGGHP